MTESEENDILDDTDIENESIRLDWEGYRADQLLDAVVDLRKRNNKLNFDCYTLNENLDAMIQRHAALWWRTMAGRTLLGIAWGVVLYKALRGWKRS